MKTKILVLVGIAVCVMLVTSPALASAGYSMIYGNANEDDVLDMRDVTYLKLVIFGKKSATTLADANYDGKISMLDVGQTKLIILDKEKQLTLIDHANRTVTLPRPIERVVTCNPDPARLMVALGECDKFVGVTSSDKRCICRKMLTVCRAEVCGGKLFELPEVVTDAGDKNLELIVSLKPDIIFGVSQGEADVVQEKTGIPTVYVTLGGGHEFEKMYEEMELMGAIFKKENEAKEFISFVKETVGKIEEVTSQIPEEEKPKVYFASRHIGWGGGFLATTGHYDPLNIAGGINVAEGIPPGTTRVLKEQIIAWNPDIIIIAHSSSSITFVETNDVEIVLSDPDLQTINAVKNKKVYYTPYAYCRGRPHDKNLVTTVYLAKLLHPDKFEDLDVEEEGNEIMKGFLGVDGLFSEYADYTIWMREFLEAQQ
jgi:iron complex transport system substrate-binding protein